MPTGKINDEVNHLVPLFASYCGGLGRLISLEDALAILLSGDWTGKRLLQGGLSHALRLSWNGEMAPQEILNCDLIFPDLPDVKYSFALPCHQLVQWLMDREGEQLPVTFWQWLLLGQPPVATKAVGSAA